jgi:hypothetical protein
MQFFLYIRRILYDEHIENDCYDIASLLFESVSTNFI